MIRSDAHAVVSGYVSYEFLEKYEIAVNGYNLGNEKYLTSLYWDQSFYAAAFERDRDVPNDALGPDSRSVRWMDESVVTPGGSQ